MNKPSPVVYIYVFVFTTILTLMLIWQTVGDANGPSWAATYSIMVVMLAVSCASWWHSVKQAKERRDDKIESRAMREQIINLADQLAATTANMADDDLADGFIDLSRVTKAKLRERVIAYAARMRAFEADRRLRQAELSMTPGVPDVSEEERLNEWQVRTDRLLREAVKQQKEFRARIWPEALAFEHEIAGRLGRSISNEDMHPVALRRGLIAGISPVADAANYLEIMAHEL